MADILPSPIPPVLPGLGGPAISFSATRKVLDAAKRLGDDLEQKIRQSVQSGLADAAREGIRVETKVTNHLNKQLTPPEQLISHITALVQNSIAGNLAQAVTTFEDLTGIGGVSEAATQGLGGVSQQSLPFVTAPALTKSSPVSVAALRATRPPGGGVSPQFFGPLLGENNPGINPPGPCQMIDQATWVQWQNQAQAIADQCNKGSPPAGEEFTGNWWRCSEDCCVTGPARAPEGNPAIPVAKYFDFAIDGYASCIKPAFAWFLKQWNPTGLGCGGKPPVDCVKTPLDPSCPPNCFIHPEDPRCVPTTCPPNPCVIDVTCPPPVINIPPCPPFNLPSCIQIDLCDWDKFCKFLKDCLTQSKEDCALDNETAYTYKDCDGSYGEAQTAWLGSLANGVAAQETVDDINTLAQQLPATLTAENFGSLQPY